MKYLVLTAVVLVGCGVQAEPVLPELGVQAIKHSYGKKISEDCHAKWLPEYMMVARGNEEGTAVPS